MDAELRKEVAIDRLKTVARKAAIEHRVLYPARMINRVLCVLALAEKLARDPGDDHVRRSLQVAGASVSAREGWRPVADAYRLGTWVVRAPGAGRPPAAVAA